MDKRLQQLREEYKNVQIPKELDIIVEKALQQETKKEKNRYVADISSNRCSYFIHCAC